MSDDRRFALYFPRGISKFDDNLNPFRTTHSITVYGWADLQRRLDEAEAIGVRGQVSYTELTGEVR